MLSSRLRGAATSVTRSPKVAVHQHHLAASHNLVAHDQVHRIGDMAVQFDHVARPQIENLAQRHLPRAKTQRGLELDIEQQLESGSSDPWRTLGSAGRQTAARRQCAASPERALRLSLRWIAPHRAPDRPRTARRRSKLKGTWRPDLPLHRDLLELLHLAFLARLGQQLSGRGLGHLAQQLAPARLLVHAFAHQRCVENGRSRSDREAALLFSGQRGAESQRIRGLAASAAIRTSSGSPARACENSAVATDAQQSK